jgi:hypothetical protein
MRVMVAVVGAVVVAAFGGGGTRAADDPPAKDVVKAIPDLVGALKKSPGCLGVETAKTSSGKAVIFAWFEDKKAALAWYKSDVHKEAMKQFLPDARSGRKPLADVPDDSGPIMVVASVTPKEPTKDDPSPFKQIAIEVYQPLGEGLAIGGKFAPEKMKVPPRKEEGKK